MMMKIDFSSGMCIYFNQLHTGCNLHLRNDIFDLKCSNQITNSLEVGTVLKCPKINFRSSFESRELCGIEEVHRLFI